ncbi:hypothetical protein EcB171_3760 [Escherichia coli B171]|nr:hypothetical protein EcB171_3760 [Escherichia coli B171]
MPLDVLGQYEKELYEFIESKYPEIYKEIREKKEISPELEQKMMQVFKEFNELFKKNNNIEPVPIP